MSSNSSRDTYPPASQVRKDTIALEAGDRDQEGQSGDAADSPSTFPAAFQPTPPLVKVTAWRLLNTVVIFAFGMGKAVSTYLGYSTVPTTLDWIFGVVWVIISYWVGLLENESPTVAPWLFDYDVYSSGILGSVIIGFLILYWVVISLFANFVVFSRLSDLNSGVTVAQIVSILFLIFEIVLGCSIFLVALHLRSRLSILLPRRGLFSRSDWSLTLLGWPEWFLAFLVYLCHVYVFIRIMPLLPESPCPFNTGTPLCLLVWTVYIVAYIIVLFTAWYIILGLCRMVCRLCYRLCSERRRRRAD